MKNFQADHAKQIVLFEKIQKLYEIIHESDNSGQGNLQDEFIEFIEKCDSSSGFTAEKSKEIEKILITRRAQLLNMNTDYTECVALYKRAY